MTIAEIVKVIADAKEVRIVWNGEAHKFNHTDPLILDAFGKYVVDGVYAVGEEIFELSIAARPSKIE